MSTPALNSGKEKHVCPSLGPAFPTTVYSLKAFLEEMLQLLHPGHSEQLRQLQEAESSLLFPRSNEASSSSSEVANLLQLCILVQPQGYQVTARVMGRRQCARDLFVSLWHLPGRIYNGQEARGLREAVPESKKEATKRGFCWKTHFQTDACKEDICWRGRSHKLTSSISLLVWLVSRTLMQRDPWLGFTLPINVLVKQREGTGIGG